jgi:nicotinamidase-related amidase
MNQGLVLVDIQNDYFPNGRMELVGMEEAGRRAKELMGFFQGAQFPTFHIQHIAASPKTGFFLPDTLGAEIHENVKPRPTDPVIQKHFPNSFRNTNLLEELNKAEVDEIVICGAMSHMCIDATTRAAADLGFRCNVIHDACATRDLEFEGGTIPASQVHASFMAALRFFYAKVISLEEFLSKS